MEKKHARLLLTSGEEKTIVPENGTDFSLKELYALLECEMIEVVPLHKMGKILILDEEGMSNRKQQNTLATVELAMEDVFTPPNGYLGHVIICDNDMLK